VKDWAVHII
jgi:hypothetical protein